LKQGSVVDISDAGGSPSVRGRGLKLYERIEGEDIE